MWSNKEGQRGGLLGLFVKGDVAVIAYGTIIISVPILPNGNSFGSSHIGPDESELAIATDNDKTERRKSWSAFELT